MDVKTTGISVGNKEEEEEEEVAEEEEEIMVLWNCGNKIVK